MEKKSLFFEKRTIEIQSWYTGWFCIEIDRLSRQIMLDFDNKSGNIRPPSCLKRRVFEVLYKKLGIGNGFVKRQREVCNDASLESLE
jgi:hypothetical protein